MKTGNFVLDYVQKKKDGFKIGILMSFSIPWCTQELEDLKTVAEEYKNQGIIKEIVLQQGTDNTVQQQNQLIDGMINSGVDAIVVHPVTDNSLGPMVQKTMAKGIPIVSIIEDRSQGG